MSDTTSVLLSEAETASFFGISRRTLQHWRSHGTGPRFFRLGSKSIRYRREDIMAFLDTHVVEPEPEDPKAA